MNLPAPQPDITTVFMSYYDMIVTTSRRYVPLPDLVHDIVQQCYIEFSRNIEKGHWSLNQDCGPLLRQLAKSRSINIWREQREHLPDYQQAIADRLSQRVKERNDEIESSAREIKALEFCMQNLSASSRQLIEQHYFGGKTIESIATENKMNPGSLRQTFCRIRAKLKHCIEQTLKILPEE